MLDSIPRLLVLFQCSIIIEHWNKLTEEESMRFRILVLALGAFAVGTDGFVIAGILPDIAESMGISLALAGLTITTFALVYAFGAPILSAWAGAIERRRLLLTSLLVLMAANLLAALAP